MIYKNNYTFLKFLPFVRLFFILFAFFLSFFLGKPILESYDADDWVGFLLVEFVPIMFFIIILLEACFTKYFESFEFKNEFISIKHGNGYFNKKLLINKNSIKSFYVDIVAIDRYYFTKSRSKYITFDTIINISLENGTVFTLKDNTTGLEIINLLCLIKKEIPDFKFVSSLHNQEDENIVKDLKPWKNSYNKLLSDN